MKKKVIVTVMAVALSVSTLVGCGGNNNAGAAAPAADSTATATASVDASAIVGSWLSGSFAVNGEVYDPDTYAEMNGLTSDDIVSVYTFDENGTVSATLAGAEATGTYTFDGTYINTTFENGSTVKFEYDAENDGLGVEDPASGVITFFARLQ